ncbi:hypothetical protein COO60DRAFT_334013, partial [Scenedesmus sp. NREL 46B-D3]
MVYQTLQDCKIASGGDPLRVNVCSVHTRPPCCGCRAALTRRSITSLYVGGVTPDITEEDLKDAFYTYGEIAGVRKVASRFCAFVTFAERSAAEAAADGLANKLIVKGIRLRLMWGRPQQGRQQQQLEHDPMQPIPSGAGGAAAAAAATAGGGGGGGGGDYFGLQQQPAAMSYPSMDPTAMGARISVKRTGEGGEDDASKRQRAAAPAGTGYGAPLPQGGAAPGYGLVPHLPPPHLAGMHGAPRPPLPGGMQMPPMPQMGMQMPPPATVTRSTWACSRCGHPACRPARDGAADGDASPWGCAAATCCWCCCAAAAAAGASAAAATAGGGAAAAAAAGGAAAAAATSSWIRVQRAAVVVPLMAPPGLLCWVATVQQQ